jgi:hypothetical protein
MGVEGAPGSSNASRGPQGDEGAQGVPGAIGAQDPALAATAQSLLVRIADVEAALLVCCTPPTAPAWLLVGLGGGASASNSVSMSADGRHWFGQGADVFSNDAQGVAWNGTNRWMAVGVDFGAGAHTLAHSPDGVAWTGVSNPGGLMAFGAGVAYGVNVARWVVVGGVPPSSPHTIIYSDDQGATWSPATASTSVFSVIGIGVAYNGADLWVACGQGTNSLAHSTDGVAWTGQGTSVFSAHANFAAYNQVDDVWIAAGEGASHTLARSTSADGSGTTFVGLGKSVFTTRALGVAYSALTGRWVAVGAGTNSIAWSDDNGTTWTGVGTSILSVGHAVACDDVTGLFVATGLGAASSSIAFSDDGGVSWTGVPSSTANVVGTGEGVAFQRALP